MVVKYYLLWPYSGGLAVKMNYDTRLKPPIFPFYFRRNLLYYKLMKYAVILNPASGNGKSLGVIPKLQKWAKKKKLRQLSLNTAFKISKPKGFMGNSDSVHFL